MITSIELMEHGASCAVQLLVEKKMKQEKNSWAQ